MVLCIAGFGEVGQTYAHALSEAGEGVDVVCDPKFTDSSLATARSLGASAERSIGAWLETADTVLSAVTGSIALKVADDCLCHMKPGALYVDLTTAPPDAMRDAAARARDHGIAFVDVGIMGAISVKKGRTALVCAGDGAQRFQMLAAKLGAPVKILPGSAGDAIRLKLLRSVFTKGLEALAVESLLLAERSGLRRELYECLSDVDETPLAQLLEVLVRSHVIHSARRSHEVQDAQDQMLRDGIEPLVTPGVRNLFERTRAAGTPPATDHGLPSIEAALGWLMDIASAPGKAAK